jgi:tRNA dimethylallyltransferase
MKEVADAARSGKLVCIVGPTATGKTELAVRVAEEVGGEIVSADSVQVYRRFELGTGKPSADERRRAPHHLVDIVEPMDPMDAARWVALADSAIANIRARGKIPIVCGGTFLWVKALVSGLAGAPPADETIRTAHRALVDKEGRPALHAKLAAVDPKSAARLHPNDLVRVSRALEVFELTGETMTDVQERHAFRSKRHDFELFAITMSSDDLRARIEKRVRAWLDAGWIEEVKALILAGFREARAMSSVGFKEIAEGPLDETVAIKIVQHTRVFARRQRTWLNHEPVRWLSPAR